MKPRLANLRGSLDAFHPLDRRRELVSRLALWRDEVGESGYRGHFLSNSKESDLHTLVEHFTAPALARALRDRETALSQCSAAFARADMKELEELLHPFRKVGPKAPAVMPELPLAAAGGLFAPEILAELSVRLARLPREVTKRASKRASVVIPLLHHNGEPSVLFTKRSVSLRRHPGEVCFPGGMVEDNLDKTIVDAGCVA
jgi:nudix motif 8